jgi:hypothetical protein
MIPTIEEIFHALSRGEMAFADAETYLRTHIRLAHRLGHRLDKIELRDKFAGRAMQELLHQEDLGPYFMDIRKLAVARQAYIMADAMLEARKP